jgi:hypothetical protein
MADKTYTQISYPRGKQDASADGKYPARAAIGVTLNADHDESGGVPSEPKRFWGFATADGVTESISAFLKPAGEKDGKAYGPFLSVAERHKAVDGKYPESKMLGALNAVNTEGEGEGEARKQVPLAANRTPYLLGKIKLGDKEVMMRSYMTAEAVPLMPAMGFNESVVANFQAKLSADAEKKAAPKP